MSLPLNIDLQQILLHMLNFVILVGGLYFILYSPVKKFMDQRAARYAEMDKAAADKLSEAEKLAASHQAQLDKLDEELRERRAESQKIAQARPAAAGPRPGAGRPDHRRRPQERPEHPRKGGDRQPEGTEGAGHGRRRKAGSLLQPGRL